MLVLPFERKKKSKTTAIGFSLSFFGISVLFVAGTLAVLCLSVVYHSLLYSYTMPLWAVPITIIFSSLLTCRVRIALSLDRKILYRQISIFGVVLKEYKFKSEAFSEMSFKPTEAIANQYYLVVNGSEQGVSVYYCKLKEKRLSSLQLIFSGMLGFVE